ncbi:hypothetical protein B0G81_4744 [Paraburkholderia sp. BL6665CI2N2]|nr:hypothetical protein B0G81_4744 [Paraburkholderia sp. BL6665CI2N2]CAE6850241.1 hypothetical protein R69619_07415 [Paraburkholderia nemoris]
MQPYGKHPCSEIGNRSNQPGTLLHGLDYRQVPPSQRLHLRRQGGVMFAIPEPSGNGFAKRYERKLGVSLFDLVCWKTRVVNLLYDQQ